MSSIIRQLLQQQAIAGLAKMYGGVTRKCLVASDWQIKSLAQRCLEQSTVASTGKALCIPASDDAPAVG